MPAPRPRSASRQDLFAGTERLKTLGQWLHFAETGYARAGLALGQVATNAHDEALYLLLRTLELPLDSGREVLRRRLTQAQVDALRTVLYRRIVDRVPAAYLTREAWLGGHRFYVDERVLIPRSYFLEIIPGQIEEWLPWDRPVRRAADVCTGSGCLALLLAHQFPAARVDACDLSPDALAVARLNVRQHGLEGRVKLYESDVFDAVPRAKYDLIISNPPYVPSRELRRLAPEFRREPALALDGGRDGLAIIRKLLRQARERLHPHGVVMIEVGGLRAAINREFAAIEPHWLHTQDGEDCVCVIHAARLRAGRSSR
ncbi:MAG: 50S ribosomal protein L3 N(5)-glutamine methyltransferase [Opitutaceae bacterium]|nr:50S ribosomal protein L3 N(5)-glutamine methyltransferase [Opitutaceae bacterium]